MTLAEIFLVLGIILPSEQPFTSTSIQGPSFGSVVGHIQGASGADFVYRFEKKLNPELFLWDVTVSETAASLSISPKVMAKDLNSGCMVLEYIETQPWPAFEENPGPYLACMQQLRLFHENSGLSLEPYIQKCPHKDYFPFDNIKKIVDCLPKIAISAPRQFFQVCELVDEIYMKIRPWIERTPRVCHNDFHHFNCLNGKDRTYIIDWTTASPYADPFHDIASFSVILNKDQRKVLLESYLGRLPSVEEYTHYRLMEFVSLVRVAALCFYDQRKDAFFSAEETKNLNREMEDLIDKGSLRGVSYLSTPYALDAKQLRKRALSALQESLDIYEEIKNLLENFEL